MITKDIKEIAEKGELRFRPESIRVAEALEEAIDTMNEATIGRIDRWQKKWLKEEVENPFKECGFTELEKWVLDNLDKINEYARGKHD